MLMDLGSLDWVIPHDFGQLFFGQRVSQSPVEALEHSPPKRGYRRRASNLSPQASSAHSLSFLGKQIGPIP